LAALVYSRTWETTDALVRLLLRVVHAIGAQADRQVTKQLVAEFRRVHGKENLLFRVAEASAARPDETVRQVVFPVLGEDNLQNLIAEYKSSGSTYRRTCRPPTGRPTPVTTARARSGCWRCWSSAAATPTARCSTFWTWCTATAAPPT
jgi:hypothetical protein